MRLLILFSIFIIPNAFAESFDKDADKIVNKHLSSTAKKQELKKQRGKIEARKAARVVPPKPQPRKNPAESQGVILEQEPNAFANEKTEEVYKPLRDPSAEIQSEVAEERQEYAETDYEKRKLIQKIKKEAEKSGYRVNVLKPE